MITHWVNLICRSVKCVFMYLGHGKPIHMYPDPTSLAPLKLPYPVTF